ncbi:unnamed protein product [Malus baccata var. baccata]
MYKISGRKARWKGRVLDRSLSSDLCHDRCACMAGQKNISIKNNEFLVLRGDSMGFFCPGFPLRCGVCSLPLSFCSMFQFCLPPTANSRTWIPDNYKCIDISPPKVLSDSLFQLICTGNI